jgi:hypothetical protein
MLLALSGLNCRYGSELCIFMASILPVCLREITTSTQQKDAKVRNCYSPPTTVHEMEVIKKHSSFTKEARSTESRYFQDSQ